MRVTPKSNQRRAPWRTSPIPGISTSSSSSIVTQYAARDQPARR